MILNSPSRIHSLLDPARFMRYGTGPGGTGAAVWSPLDLSPMVWLDATQESYANGGAVSQFSDRSGNGNHFVQSTPASQPTFLTNGINNKPAISFDGVSAWLNLASLGAQSTWYGVVVYRMASIVHDAVIWAIDNYRPDAAYCLFGQSTSTGNQVGVNSFARIATAINTDYAILIQGSSTLLTVSDDNGASNSNATLNWSKAADQSCLGRRGDGNYAAVDIGEVVFGSGTLSAGDVAEMWTYLSNKWGTGIP